MKKYRKRKTDNDRKAYKARDGLKNNNNNLALHIFGNIDFHTLIVTLFTSNDSYLKHNRLIGYRIQHN